MVSKLSEQIFASKLAQIRKPKCTTVITVGVIYNSLGGGKVGRLFKEIIKIVHIHNRQKIHI